MAKIEIRNIGPIGEGGIIEFSPVTVLFGPQSSGKSTLLKILSFCTWLEKQIMLPEGTVGNIVYDFTHYYHFRTGLAQFHRFDSKEFSSESYIRYEGDCVEITMAGLRNASVRLHPEFREKRHNTKISFIPAERNIVSAIRNYDRLVRAKDIDSLINYILEWQEARENFKSKNALSLSADNDIKYFFDEARQGEYFRFRRKDKEESLPLFYASSGIQASLPVDVLVNYFASQVRQEINLTAAMLSALDKPSQKYPSPERLRRYQSAKFFIEEPELSLFPASQSALTANILRTVNRLNSEGAEYPLSRVGITTHSPYILNCLNLAIKGADAYARNPEEARKIMPQENTVSFRDVKAYFIADGELRSIMDDEIKMISGVELDSASERELEIDSQLDGILFSD